MGQLDPIFRPADICRRVCVNSNRCLVNASSSSSRSASSDPCHASAVQALAPEARENSGRLRGVASLADRVSQRLAGLGPEQRRELAALLELRVEVAGPVMDGEPCEVRIRVVLDPRIA